MSKSSDIVGIRPITPDDAETAAGLSAELGYPADTATMRTRIEQLGGLPDHAVFVACSSNDIVGWIHVAVVHHLQSDARAEIGGLVVAAAWRSGGVGARLVARAEQWARESGVASIVVRSQIMRDAAHRFYAREGYTRTKTSAVFSKLLEE